MNRRGTDFIPPGVIRIEPASNCNFKCVHCPTGIGVNKNLGLSVMKKEIFDEIFSKINHLKYRVGVLYHGGEPLLNKHIFHMIETLKPICKKVKIVTNGSLITDEKIDQLLASSLDMLEISLDGLSPEENNSIRIGADFNQIAWNINKLLAKRKKIGSKLSVFISNIQIQESENANSTLELPPAYIKKAFSEYLADITFRSYHAMYWPDYPAKIKYNQRPERNQCDHVQSVMTIRWNGDVVPCCYDLTSHAVLGNILKNSLEEIWSGELFNQFRERIANYTPPTLCNGCGVLFEPRKLYKNELKDTFVKS